MVQGAPTAFLLVVAVLGCGPVEKTDESTGDGTTHESNPHGGSATSEDSGSSDDPEGTGTEVGEDAGDDVDDSGECELESSVAEDRSGLPVVDCSDFFDEIVGPAVDVLYTNNSKRDVFVPFSACYEGSFRILGPGGRYIRWTDDGWITNCGQIITSDSCGGAACTSTVYRIIPGGSLSERWHGGMLVAHVLPEECYAGGECGRYCDQLVQVDPGCLEFQVEWGTSYNCYLVPEDECTCEPGPSGNCRVRGGAELEQPSRTKRRTIWYPETRRIEFVFE